MLCYRTQPLQGGREGRYRTEPLTGEKGGGENLLLVMWKSGNSSAREGNKMYRNIKFGILMVFLIFILLLY